MAHHSSQLAQEEHERDGGGGEQEREQRACLVLAVARGWGGRGAGSAVAHSTAVVRCLAFLHPPHALRVCISLPPTSPHPFCPPHKQQETTAWGGSPGLQPRGGVAPVAGQVVELDAVVQRRGQQQQKHSGQGEEDGGADLLVCGWVGGGGEGDWKGKGRTGNGAVSLGVSPDKGRWVVNEGSAAQGCSGQAAALRLAAALPRHKFAAAPLPTAQAAAPTPTWVCDALASDTAGVFRGLGHSSRKPVTTSSARMLQQDADGGVDLAEQLAGSVAKACGGAQGWAPSSSAPLT